MVIRPYHHLPARFGVKRGAIEDYLYGFALHRFFPGLSIDEEKPYLRPLLKAIVAGKDGLQRPGQFVAAAFGAVLSAATGGTGPLPLLLQGALEGAAIQSEALLRRISAVRSRGSHKYHRV